MGRARVTTLLATLLLPLAGLEARLVQIQLVRPAEDPSLRRTSLKVVRAVRGRILDVRGEVLAQDRPTFDVYLVLEEYEKSPGPIPGVSAEEVCEGIERIYAKIEKQAARCPARERRFLVRRERRTPYLLRTDISREAAIAIEAAQVPGGVVRAGLKRSYPRAPGPSHRQLYGGGLPGCHLLGYLGRATEEEFAGALQNGRFWPGFEEAVGQDGIARIYQRGEWDRELMGKEGLERRYDDDLRGHPGLVLVEQTQGLSKSTSVELKPPQRGRDLELTIDIRVQEAVEEILAGPLRAAAVVMDPRDGALRALASNRLYDPNDFIPPGHTESIRRALGDREGQPMASRALRNYPLGSIFKVATSVAGLEEGKVVPTESLPCHGKFLENSRGFACHVWNSSGGSHGDIDLAAALERSCNCYYYEVGRRCGLASVVRWAGALGLGAPTGLDLPGEAPGRLPDRARGINDVLNVAIGQGEVLVTPLQAAVMMAVIANGGLRVSPYLRRGGGRPPCSLGLATSTLEALRRGLREVVQSPKGTAHAAGLQEFDGCGKTSTAQVGAGLSHAWFAGYAPMTSPRYVMTVFVEHGGHGGETAAPLAARILAALRKLE